MCEEKYGGTQKKLTSLKGGGVQKKDTPARESTHNHIIKLYDFHQNLGGHAKYSTSQRRGGQIIVYA